jgi:multiple antibiotic resistance protein
MAIEQRGIKSNRRSPGTLSGWTLVKVFMALLLLGAVAPAAFAQATGATARGRGAPPLWTIGEAFTFLFITLGPLNVIGPFVAMTNERGQAFKRRLAFKASVVAAIALLVAATVGAATLQAWDISVGALLLAAGVILFLVALGSVMAGYNARAPGVQASAAAPVPAPSESELAFSPLAFPTIITPYGIALLILLFTLYPLASGGLRILATAALVLALDLLAMLAADWIAKIPFMKPGLDILGCVMNVLLVALGAQVVADGLRLIAEPIL